MCPGWGKFPHPGHIACCSSPNSRPPATKTLHTICGNNTSIVSSSWWWARECPKHVEQIISAIKHSVATSCFSSLRLYGPSLSRKVLSRLWPRPKCNAQGIGSSQKYAVCARLDHARLRSAWLRSTSKCYLPNHGPSHDLVPSTCIQLVQQQMLFSL